MKNRAIMVGETGMPTRGTKWSVSTVSASLRGRLQPLAMASIAARGAGKRPRVDAITWPRATAMAKVSCSSLRPTGCDLRRRASFQDPVSRAHCNRRSDSSSSRSLGTASKIRPYWRAFSRLRASPVVTMSAVRGRAVERRVGRRPPPPGGKTPVVPGEPRHRVVLVEGNGLALRPADGQQGDVAIEDFQVEEGSRLALTHVRPSLIVIGRAGSVSDRRTPVSGVWRKGSRLARLLDHQEREVLLD